MPRDAYRERLVELRGEVGAMADLALDRYEESIDVLVSGDPTKARAIIDGDSELNEWYLDIERECIDLLALQQPVAGDLRFIAATFKIITDVERVGDLATNLARYGLEADGELFSTVAIEPIATTAGEMVADAIDAYTKEKPDVARAVADRDDDLDEMCREASETVVRDVMTATTGSAETETILEGVSRSLLTIRDLERVGDHAVNICARTLYMTDNDDTLIY